MIDGRQLVNPHQPPTSTNPLPHTWVLPSPILFLSHFISRSSLSFFFIPSLLLLQQRRRASPATRSISSGISHREGDYTTTSFTSTGIVLLQQLRGVQASVLTCFCTFLACMFSSFPTSLFYFPYSFPVLLSFLYSEEFSTNKAENGGSIATTAFRSTGGTSTTIPARRTAALLFSPFFS